MAPPDRPATTASARVDRGGRLVRADGLVLALQQEAGGTLDGPLLVPPLGALAAAAEALGSPLSHAMRLASEDCDHDVIVSAAPDATGCTLLVEEEGRAAAAANGRWDDRDLRSLEFDEGFVLRSMTSAAAAALGTSEAHAKGQSLARLVELVAEPDGHYPMLDVLRTRCVTVRQRARRRGDGRALLIELHRDGDAIHADATLCDPELSEEAAPADGLVPAPSEAGDGGESLDSAFQGEISSIVAAAHSIMKRDEGPLRTDYQQYATDIAAAGEHLKSVVRGLYHRGEPASGDDPLEASVRRAVHIVAEEARLRRLEIRFEPIPGCRIAGRESDVVQILVNLLGNAIRYSPEGGTVSVTMTRVENWIGVEVTDEGEGMTIEQQASIFNRYERGSGGQSGIGLAVSRRLARMLGGEIDVASAPGRGSTFTLLLPSA